MSFDVAIWSAPYSDTSIGRFQPMEGVKPNVGDLLLTRCSAHFEGNAVTLVELVRRCRRCFPGSPAVVWVPEARPDRVIELVRAATSAHVRAILGGKSICADQLRAQLTSPEAISPFVLRWAADAGYLPTDNVHAEVSTLLAAAPNVRTLERLARERQVAARTWRGKLQQMGLPTPRAWLGLAHALHVAFFLQRNSTLSLQTLSDELGLQNVAIMSQQFRRVFGISPGQVRDLLGAEPLLQRWFQAQGRSAG